MNRTKDWDRLADYVLNWRVRKGWDRAELAKRMKMGERTVERIENSVPVRGATLAALELALDWEPGDARRVLTGLEPVAASKVEGKLYPNDPERQRIWDELSTKELVGREVSDEKRAELVEEIMEIMGRRGHGGSAATGT